MFYEPQPTRYDLNFHLFGFPVRIHPFFWLLTVFLGANFGGPALIMWVLAVTFSILVHELGHALAWRCFGIPTHIVLYSFGGLTIAPRGYNLRWFENAFVSFAGPGAGFLVYGIFSLISPDLFSVNGKNFLTFILYINLYWGIFNLLPVYPLDGGQIVREIATHFSQRNGLVYTMNISLVTAIMVIGAAISQKEFFIALLFVWMAISNYQVLKQISYH